MFRIFVSKYSRLYREIRFEKVYYKIEYSRHHRVDLSKSQLAVVRAGSLTRNYQQSKRSPPILYKNSCICIYFELSLFKYRFKHNTSKVCLDVVFVMNTAFAIIYNAGL